MCHSSNLQRLTISWSSMRAPHHPIHKFHVTIAMCLDTSQTITRSIYAATRKIRKAGGIFSYFFKKIPWKQRVTGSVIPFTTIPRHYSANVSIPLFPPPSNPSHIPSAIVLVNTLPYCPQKFMVQRSMSPLPCALTHLKQTHVLQAKHTRLVQIYNLSSVQTTCHRFHHTIHYNFRALEEEFATTFPCFHLILPSSLNYFIHSFATCSGRQHSILPTGKKIHSHVSPLFAIGYAPPRDICLLHVAIL